MIKTVEVLDERSVNIDMLGKIYKKTGYKVDFLFDHKTIVLLKKHCIPLMLQWFPRKQQIVFSIAIDVRANVDELTLARVIRKMNDKSFYSAFNYRFSKIYGHRLIATSTINSADGVSFMHLVQVPNAFYMEFMKLCFSSIAKSILYLKNGRLFVSSK